MDSKRRRDAGADLKATGEDLAADARHVAAIEDLKVELDPGDPRVVALSVESERITAGMASKAKMETALSREAAAEPSN